MINSTEGRVKILPFAPEHLGWLEPPVPAPADSAVWSLGPNFTLFLDGRPVACGGVVVRGDHGILWSHLSDEIRRHPMILHRRVRRGIADLSRKHGLRSLEASARSDFPVAKHWLRRLGFEEMNDVTIDGHSYTRFLKWQK